MYLPFAAVNSFFPGIPHPQKALPEAAPSIVYSHPAYGPVIESSTAMGADKPIVEISSIYIYIYLHMYQFIYTLKYNY